MWRTRAFALLAVAMMPGCAGAPARSPILSLEPGGSRDHLHQTAVTGGPVLPPPTEGQESEFCKLNPGACPEPLPAPEPGESEATADPWKSFACIQACKVGGDAMEEFCRELPGRTKRQQKIKAVCWSVSHGGRAACIVFCRAYFGPPIKQ